MPISYNFANEKSAVTLLSSCWGFFVVVVVLIFGCAGSSLLRRLFSSCIQWGLLSSRGAWASRCGGFSLL